MFGEDVTILSRVQTGTDRYGNPVYDWPSPGTTVRGCAVAPRTSEEPTQINRMPVYDGMTVYAPPGTAVGPHDRIVVRGVLYEVDGEAGDWRSPFTSAITAPRGVLIYAKRVEG